MQTANEIKPHKWRGWIIGTENDRQLLKRLGITIIKSKREINNKIEFDVNEITGEVLSKLDKYWGRLIWGLESY